MTDYMFNIEGQGYLLQSKAQRIYEAMINELNLSYLDNYLKALANQSRLIIICSFEDTSFVDIEENFRRYFITFGLGILSQDDLEELMFEHYKFTSDQIIKYRLLHEIVHVIISELYYTKDKDLIELLRAVVEVQGSGSTVTGFAATLKRRKNKRQGLRIFNSSRITKEDIGFDPILVEEEVVELVTMYLFDRKYFSDYIEFLTDSSLERLRKAYGIKNFTPQELPTLVKIAKSVKAIAERYI